jgi:hypothetical protein
VELAVSVELDTIAVLVSVALVELDSVELVSEEVELAASLELAVVSLEVTLALV